MAFSSVSVVASSLTLRWWRRPRIARRSDDPAGDRAEGTLFEVYGALKDALQSWRRKGIASGNRSAYGVVDNDAIPEEEMSLVRSRRDTDEESTLGL